MARDHLSVADVLGLYTVLMQRYCGASGVRDPGALEAALFRPQTGYYEDIVAEAAALMESLAINHPFVDGNKRAAFVTMMLFLRKNGTMFRPPQTEATRIMLDLAAGSVSEDGLARWIGNRSDGAGNP